MMHGLLMRRVKRYYLYQCDPISGSAHFRTPVDKGIGNHRGAARPHHRLRGAAVSSSMRPTAAARSRCCQTMWSAATATISCWRNFEGGVYRYPDPGGRVGADKLPQGSLESK